MESTKLTYQIELVLFVLYLVSVFRIYATCPNWTKLDSKQGTNGHVAQGADTLVKCKSRCWSQAGCRRLDFSKHHPILPEPCVLYYEGSNSSIESDNNWDHYRLDGICDHTERCGVPSILPRLDDDIAVMKEVYRTGRPRARAIVYGEKAVPHSWPWMAIVLVAVGNGKTSVCGGTILNERWILTAAHCVDKHRRETIFVAVGVHMWENQRCTPQTQRHSIEKVVMHKYFQIHGSRDNDIALLKTWDAIAFNGHVQPVCIPTRQIPVNTPCVTTGYGVTLGTLSRNSMNQLQLLADYGRTCKRDLLCMKYRHRKNPCHGDSGGPVVCYVDNAWRQFGVLRGVFIRKKWPGDCVRVPKPAVYTRVAAYTTWIFNTMNGVEIAGTRYNHCTSLSKSWLKLAISYCAIKCVVTFC